MTETSQENLSDAEDAAEDIPAEDEDLPDEPDEQTLEGHKERSELGRKVKGIEDQVGLLSEKMQNFISKLEQQQQTDELDFVDTSNPQALEQFLDKRDQAKEQKKKEYTQQALSALKIQGVDLSQKAYSAIHNEAVNSWIEHTGDPAVDARLNFLDARVRIREQQLKSRTNPLSKNAEQDIDGLGGESGSQVDQKIQTPPKLSSAAQGFLDGHLKKTDSKIPENL